jgi:enoyl-CoA hydratase/carnithine racemase
MSVIEVSISGPRADIRLNRPEVLNALNVEVFDALASAADQVNQPGVHVVVVSAEGRSFSSGIDLSSLGAIEGSTNETIVRAQSGFRKLAELPMPTVAAVQGHAYGAGLQIALACDLRVVAEDASLGLLEMRYGLIPDCGGSSTLPLLVGPGRAKKMIWFAEKVDGIEAERIGLAEVVVPESALVKTVDEIAIRLAEPPHLAKRLSKRVVDLAHLLSHHDGMDNEAEAQERCLTSPEFGEAVARALSRSKP